jgi:hypothetical protein
MRRVGATDDKMSDEANDSNTTTEQWTAFQRMWSDTFTKMIQVGMTFGPESAPPEFMRQFRAGIFQALAKSWDEFLRSPQFMDAMKQWMDSAIAFRKMSNDFLTKAHHEAQSPAREDIDTVMLAVRHMETRILDRVGELATQVDELNKRLQALDAGKAGKRGAAVEAKAKRASSQPAEET